MTNSASSRGLAPDARTYQATIMARMTSWAALEVGVKPEMLSDSAKPEAVENRRIST